MSGTIDLSGIASRAYAPGAKQTQTARGQTASADIGRARPAPLDRRLAPAFSVELSLAAQQALSERGAQAKPTEEVVSQPRTSSQTDKPSSAFEQIFDGVGRREMPLANKESTRDIAIGSRLNIEI